ncbi:XRE family transcriptional regulator, partial [Escherichia coli]
MTDERYANVWDAIEREQAEAANMKLRSELMIALKQRIARLELSQAEAAKQLGVT